jgi:hypothetical protein
MQESSTNTQANQAIKQFARSFSPSINIPTVKEKLIQG